MKKILFVVLLMFVVFSVSGYAYTLSGNSLYCTSCADCTNAVNNPNYNATYINADILDNDGVCIKAPGLLRNNITIDCQNKYVNGISAVDSYGIQLNGKSNITIKNCNISDFERAIYIKPFPELTYQGRMIVDYPNDFDVFEGGNKTIVAGSDSQRLHLYNTTDKTNPVLLNELYLNYSPFDTYGPHDIKVLDTDPNYAYYAKITSGFGIINMTNQSNMTIQDSVSSAYAFYNSVYNISDNIIVFGVNYTGNGIAIYNVTDHYITLLDSIVGSGADYDLGQVWRVKYHPGYKLLFTVALDNNCTSVFNVTNLTDMIPLHKYCGVRWGWGNFDIEDDLIYGTATGIDAIVVANISEDGLLTYLGNYTNSNYLDNTHGIDVENQIIYATDWKNGGVTILNATDVNATVSRNITYITGIYGPGAPYYIGSQHAAEKVGDYVFIAGAYDDAVNIFLYSDVHTSSTIQINNTNISNSDYGVYFYNVGNAILNNIKIIGSNLWDYYASSNSNAIANNIIFNNTITSFASTDVSIKDQPNPPANTTGIYNLTSGSDGYLSITNISANGWVYLNLTYDDTNSINEPDTGLWRHDGSYWYNVSNDNVDTTNNYVYGNITTFSIFGAMEGQILGGPPSSNCTYTGGDWYIGPAEDCIVVGESLQVTGNVSIYGNLTLSDTDLIINVTNNRIPYYNNVSNWIRVYDGGSILIMNQSNISANDTSKNTLTIYEFLAMPGSKLNIYDSYIGYVGSNNYSSINNPDSARYHGIRIETNNSRIINNTFDVNVTAGVNLYRSYNNTVQDNVFVGIGSVYTGGLGAMIVGGSNNTIFNNTVTDLHYGFYGWNAVGNTYANNTVYMTHAAMQMYGITLYNYSQYNLLENNTFFNLTGYDSGAIWMQSKCAYNTIRNNIIDRDYYGIYTYDNCSNQIINGNNISSSVITGINMRGDTNNTIITNNNIVGSGNYGIFFEQRTYNNTISNNILKSNVYDYYSDTLYYANITNNTFDSPGQTSIYLVFGRYIDIINNTFNSSAYGLFVSSSRYNNIINNTFTSNNYSIYFSNARDNVLVNNTFNLNNYSLYFLQSENVTLSNTKITNSQIFDYFTNYTTLAQAYNLSVDGINISFKTNNIALKSVLTSPAAVGLISLDSYLNITNTSPNSWIYLNLTYNETKAVNESNIGFWEYDGVSWLNVSGDAVDTLNNYVYGNITEFSIFAALELDLTPPIRSNGQPTGTITTTSTTISLDTNELATCRYSQSPNTPYDSMTSTATSLGTSHSWALPRLTFRTHTYYVRCSDASGNKNTDDYLITFTVQSSFTGPTGPVIGPIDIGIGDPSHTAKEISSTEVTIGTPIFVPTGGMCIRLDDGTCLNIFGDNATIHELSKIDPADYKLLLCNQSYVNAYEINITVEDAYLCFDKSKTPLEAISIYTFNGDWIELDEIIETDTEICGKIKSSPYMIAGFKTSSTQQSALEAITLAQMKLDETPNSELQSLLDQAKEAYFRCDYEDAYNLAQQAMQLEVSAPTLLIILAIIAITAGGYYFYKHPIKFKKHHKHRKSRKN